MKVFSYDSALPLTLTGPGQQLGGRLLLFLPRQVLSEGQGDDHLQAGGARAVPGGLHHADGPGVPEDHKLGGGGEGWSTAAGCVLCPGLRPPLCQPDRPGEERRWSVIGGQ